MGFVANAITPFTVILSRRSCVAEGGAAEDGRRTPSLLSRKGGGTSHGQAHGGSFDRPTPFRASRCTAPAAQDDSVAVGTDSCCFASHANTRSRRHHRRLCRRRTCYRARV